jgi:hypothetical protein
VPQHTGHAVGPGRARRPLFPGHERNRSISARCTARLVSGIIRGALLDVDLASIGRPVQALISIRIRPPKRQVLEAFRDWAAQLPETVGVFVVAGHADVNTSVVYEHIRNPRVDPAPLPRRARTS